MRLLAAACMTFLQLTLVGCGGGNSSSGAGETATEAESPLAQALTPFVRVKDERAFFADEATSAGVQTIRPMGPGEQFTEHSNEPACGIARYSERIILINTNSARCSPDAELIAAEIAHFGTRDSCPGHGPGFFDYFRGLAKRYSNRFPNGTWPNPESSVDADESKYINSGEYGCLKFADG